MNFLQFEAIFWITCYLLLLSAVIHHSVAVSSQNAAHDKITRSWEDVDRILLPYNLSAKYASDNCWTVYDCTYDKTFSLMIPSTKFLSLLRQLKQGKITIEDFLIYLRVEEAKHVKKLQKSKEL